LGILISLSVVMVTYLLVALVTLGTIPWPDRCSTPPGSLRRDRRRWGSLPTLGRSP
jgi:amino acid transporter